MLVTILQYIEEPPQQRVVPNINRAEVEKLWPREQQALCYKKREEKRRAKVWFGREKSKGLSLERAYIGVCMRMCV